MPITRHGTVVEAMALTAGPLAHAEGFGTAASGPESHAEGNLTVASGNASHAEGQSTTASASMAHAEGVNSVASGAQSHAEGYQTTASGTYSHAQGRNATANKLGQHAQSSIIPGNLSGTMSQYSIYTVGGSLGSTTSTSVELTMYGDGTVVTAGASTSVLVIPLKSAIMLQYDFVARPNAAASASPSGAAWTGSLLLGRGNSTGATASYSNTTNGSASTQVTVNAVYGFDTPSTQVLLSYQINNTTDSSNEYLKWTLFNNGSGLAWSIVGVLRCVELVTSV